MVSGPRNRAVEYNAKPSTIKNIKYLVTFKKINGGDQYSRHKV